MASERKPMTFNLERSPVAVALAVGAERQQIGARVTKASYRQLKARAALNGEPVQALVERAIDEFLAKPTR
jgi:hypothetical protein